MTQQFTPPGRFVAEMVNASIALQEHEPQFVLILHDPITERTTETHARGMSVHDVLGLLEVIYNGLVATLTPPVSQPDSVYPAQAAELQDQAAEARPVHQDPQQERVAAVVTSGDGDDEEDDDNELSEDVEDVGEAIRLRQARELLEKNGAVVWQEPRTP